jgi:hypothetical protein
VTEGIDVDAADLLVCQWIAERARRANGCDDDDADSRWGLAMDGKTVPRSGAGNPDANVKLFSALLHDGAVVIAQLRVPDTTTEVTQVEALLDPVDLTNAVVTGDAAHTPARTAAYIRRRDGDYVLTLKANQPSLLESVIAKLFTTTTDPAHHLDTRTASGSARRSSTGSPASATFPPRSLQGAAASDRIGVDRAAMGGLPPIDVATIGWAQESGAAPRPLRAGGLLRLLAPSNGRPSRTWEHWTSSPPGSTRSSSAHPAPANHAGHRPGDPACQAGHRVAFATAAEWVARLAAAHRAGRL